MGEPKVFKFDGSILAFQRILEHPEELEDYLNVVVYRDTVQVEYIERYTVEDSQMIDPEFLDVLVLPPHRREIIEQFNVEANGKSYMIFGCQVHRHSNLMYYAVPFQL